MLGRETSPKVWREQQGGGVGGAVGCHCGTNARVSVIREGWQAGGNIVVPRHAASSKSVRQRCGCVFLA